MAADAGPMECTHLVMLCAPNDMSVRLLPDNE